MAFISVSYTFTNGTTADAVEVNQNFADIIAGTLDGTKTFNIAALTVSGAATFNGAVALGNSQSDDITISGSIASSIPIKTTFTYDIGTASLGLRYIFLGSADSAARSTKIAGATIAADWTMTLPTGAGTDGYQLITNGSGVTSWQPFTGISNIGISATVAANAMTIALKTAAGSDPSSTDPVYVSFRSSTATTGTPVLRKVTSALSTVISSGSTLGSTNNIQNSIYVYLIDNAGTVELAFSGSKMADEGTLVTTTTEGGAGGADSKTTLYSTNSRSNVAIRLIGRIKSTQATAGTWATSPSEIALWPFDLPTKIAYLELTGSTANGSSLTQVVRWTTVTENTSGTAFTLTQSSTNGDSITINEDGIYSVVVSFGGSGGADWAISRNNSGAVSTLTNTQQLTMFEVPGEASGRARTLCYTGKLNAGDVIRVNSNTTFQSLNGYGCSLKLTQLGKI
mgnify:FL=1